MEGNGFAKLVYGTLEGNGIDTKDMPFDDAVKKFNELGGESNWKAKIMKKEDEENQVIIQQLKEQLSNTPSIFARTAIRNKIGALENGFGDDIESYKKWAEEQRQKKIAESESKKVVKKEEKQEQKQDYMMTHRPTESGLLGSDIANENAESPAPKDVYDKPERYFNMNDKATRESVDVIRKIRNNPNAKVTIYRATTGDSINDGDWITLSKEYANTHKQSALKGSGNIVEMVVRAKDIQWAGDDIREWGYFPSK